MTAPVDDAILEEVDDSPQQCECPGNHPDGCDEEASYAVRLRHMTDCGEVVTPLLCQDCLDDQITEAERLVSHGAVCIQCGFRVTAVGEMVGPVIPV